MPHKFVIIDGSSLVHRAFYALPLLSTATGQYTNAVYGFTTMLVKLLGDIKPDAVAVAFDKSRQTFRNEVFSEYKAQRKPTPAELAEQFPLVRDIVAAFGIAGLEEAGYEADDIIGTLACRADEKGWETVIVTGDKDALQLITKTTRVLLTRKGITELELFDIPALYNKYGLTPSQIIDLKGLMGDASDNIPGVPGVGEKTAVKLISEFGSIEDVLANIDKVSGKKLQEKLADNRELALISKKLATIECNMALGFDENEFRPRPDQAKLRELFGKFEFKSLLTKIDTIVPGAEADPVACESLPSACVVKEAGQIKDVISQIRSAGLMVCHAVTAGQLPSIEIRGLAVDVASAQVYIPKEAEGWSDILALLADKNIGKVAYDAKHLAAACLTDRIRLTGLSFDILVAAYLLDPTAASYPLGQLAAKYLEHFPAVEAKDQLAADYSVWATKVVRELYVVMPEKLRQAGLDKLYSEIELPLVEVLADMEVAGIKVDNGRLKAMSADIALRIDELLAEIYHQAGEEFNVNSTKQLGSILFEKLKLPVQKKTKTGYSTDAEVLEKLAGEHPLIDRLLEYRILTKLKSTYLDGMSCLISPATGRLHTTFNQTVTATGRLSSSEPNLQNIPIRTDVGRKIRELFVPDNGYYLLLSADYSQIELRVLAHMSGDDSLIDAFRHEKDIHTATAAEVFGVPENEVTAQMRSRAKAVNFGIVYGISDYGLSRDIGVSRKEAGLYIDSYFDRYPGVKKYIDKMIADARNKGYVTTMFGRRRYLPEIHSSNFNQRSFAERTAMNTPIQGTAADIIKKAMVDVYDKLGAKHLRSRILLQVHDELVLEVVEGELEQVSAILRQAMEQAVILDVPLTVDLKVGKNWAEAK